MKKLIFVLVVVSSSTKMIPFVQLWYRPRSEMLISRFEFSLNNKIFIISLVISFLFPLIDGIVNTIIFNSLISGLASIQVFLQSST